MITKTFEFKGVKYYNHLEYGWMWIDDEGKNRVIRDTQKIDMIKELIKIKEAKLLVYNFILDL